MREIVLKVDGRPHGQGRGRVGINPGTGRAQVFTPAATRAFASRVQDEWVRAGKPRLDKGPYVLWLVAQHERPPSHFLKDGSLSSVGRKARYPGKPDIDNVVKGVLDALVAVGAIPDDRLLVEIRARKVWGASACVLLRVESRLGEEVADARA